MNKWQASVTRALQRHKRVVTYVSNTVGAYNPSTGTTAATTTNTAIDAARVTSKRSQSDGTNIILVDTTAFYIAGNAAVVPKANDVIIDGTDKFKIDKVEKHYAGSELVMYIAYCKS